MNTSSPCTARIGSRRLTLMAAAATFALALSGAAVAQPQGGPGGPGGPGWGGGPGGPGHHHGWQDGGPGPGSEGGMPFPERMLERAKQRLNLTPSQATAWDQVAAKSKAARETLRANRLRVRDAMRAELAKLDPDFAAVAKVADEVEQKNRDLRRQVRDEWLAVYATFSAPQKAVVREMIQRRFDRAEGFGAMMRERFEHFGGPRGN
jgi:Spy/CpxP family protein refolding chaperone